MTDEAIEVLQTLWCEPTARYHGQFHHFDEVSMPPHPTDGGHRSGSAVTVHGSSAKRPYTAAAGCPLSWTWMPFARV